MAVNNAATTQTAVTQMVSNSSHAETLSFLSGMSSGFTKQNASTLSRATLFPAAPPNATTVPVPQGIHAI